MNVLAFVDCSYLCKINVDEKLHFLNNEDEQKRFSLQCIIIVSSICIKPEILAV